MLDFTHIILLGPCSSIPHDMGSMELRDLRQSRKNDWRMARFLVGISLLTFPIHSAYVNDIATYNLGGGSMLMDSAHMLRPTYIFCGFNNSLQNHTVADMVGSQSWSDPTSHEW